MDASVKFGCPIEVRLLAILALVVRGVSILLKDMDTKMLSDFDAIWFVAFRQHTDVEFWKTVELNMSNKYEHFVAFQIILNKGFIHARLQGMKYSNQYHCN